MASHNALEYNDTFQTPKNTSGYECMDSFPANIITAMGLLTNTIFLLPVNCWILWLVRKTSAVGSSDFVIFNQSLVEIINQFAIFHFVLGDLLNHNILIKLSSFLGCTYLVGRPLFQTYFCVERYLAVVHPLVYLKYSKSPTARLPVIVLMWLVTLSVGYAILNSFPKVPVKVTIGMYSAMLVTCLFCSVRILWVLKRPKPGDGEKAGSYQQKRKAFMAVTVILVTLALGYGTVSCAVVLRDHLPYGAYCSLLGFSWWMLLPSAVVQPYLYLSKVQKVPSVRNFLTNLYTNIALFCSK